MPREPFDVSEALPFLVGDGWRGMARLNLERLLGLVRVRKAFRKAAASPGEPFTEALEAFGLKVDAPSFKEAVPPTGPVVVVANHPFGGADALALGTLCGTHRPDSLMLANRMAAGVQGVGSRMIPLSILNEDAPARDNARSLRAALQHLRGGGLLCCFPSGEVATLRDGKVTEGPWSPHVAALALKAKADLAVVSFHGHAPQWFHQAGKLHPLVRTALLPRVLLFMHGQTVTCHAQRIGFQEVEAMPPQDLAAYLRAKAVEG